MTAVLPRTLALGGGSIKQLGNVLRQHGITKPLVVTDKPLVALGVVDRVVRELGASCEVYDDTVPDPTSDTCDALAARLAFGDFDGVVAVGGGSPMDTAKAACVLRDLGGRMRDYKAPALTDTTLSLPLIAVPTTAGTGSEATRFTIVVDSDSGEKMLCAGSAFVPAGAVVDYELTMGAPRALTADTGVDALCHAMEAYVSRKANPLADGFALDALRTIGASLRGACDDDAAGREGMMRASFYAGVAFSSSSVTLVHGMSRPLGARFHVAHGRSNAVLVPLVTAFSQRGDEARYADVAAALGFPDADLPLHLARLNADLGVPPLADCLPPGVTRADFLAAAPTMAREALASGSPGNNPVVPSLEDVELLYEQIYDAGCEAGALYAEV